MEKSRFQNEETPADVADDIIDSMASELKTRLHGIQIKALINESYQEEYLKLKEQFKLTDLKFKESQTEAEKKNSEIQALREQTEQLKEQLSAAKIEAAESRKSHQLQSEDFQKLKEDQVSFERQISSLKGQISALQNTLGQDAQNWKDQALQLTAAMASLEKKHNSEMAHHQLVLNSKSEKLARLNTELCTQKEQFELLAAKLAEAESERSENRRKMTELNFQLNNLKSLNGDLEFDLRKTLSENNRLQTETEEMRKDLSALNSRNFRLQTLLRRIRAYYKSTIPTLKKDCAALISKNQTLTLELQRSHKEVEIQLQANAQSERQLSDELLNLRRQFEGERQHFEEKLKSNSASLKTSYEEKVHHMTKDFQSQLSELNFRLSEEESRVYELTQQLHRKTLSLKDEMRAETQAMEQLKIEKENLLKRLDEQDLEKNKIYTEIESLRRNYQDLLKKYDMDMMQYSRVNSELRQLNLQRAEELRVLKSQLNEKSLQLVKLDLQLEDLKMKTGNL